MARLPHCGFMNVRQFCESEPRISSPTFYRLLVRPDDARDATREMLARKLKFEEWSELERAWKADDLRWGLEGEIEPQTPPTPAVTRQNASKASEQQLSPELQKAVADAILRGLKESDIRAAIELLQAKTRKR